MYRLFEINSYLFTGLGLRKLKKIINSRQSEITKDDLQALEVNKKILDIYARASEDMCKKDEEKRNEQLRIGEISRDEYSHILMRNGLFTIGRNPASMYLGNLDKLEKSSMEMLPLPQKSRNIYKKAHSKLKPLNILQNLGLALIDIPSAFLVAGSAMLLVSGSVIPPILMAFTTASLASSIFGHKTVNKNKIKGVYSDSLHEQKVLKDGKEEKSEEKDITKEIVSKADRKRFQKKLVFNEVSAISSPTPLDKLTLEEQKKFRRLAELSSKNKKMHLQDEQLVIGNLENWGATFSNNDGKLVLENVFLPNPISLSSNTKKLTDAQNDLIENISELAQSRDIEFRCSDKRINRYLLKNIKRKNRETPVIDNALTFEMGI